MRFGSDLEPHLADERFDAGDVAGRSGLDDRGLVAGARLIEQRLFVRLEQVQRDGDGQRIDAVGESDDPRLPVRHAVTRPGERGSSELDGDRPANDRALAEPRQVVGLGEAGVVDLQDLA